MCCFFPLLGKYRHQRDQVSWCVFQPRGSQLCKECRMCIKSLHSLLNSHTTVVMYSTVHMYSIVNKNAILFLKSIVAPHSQILLHLLSLKCLLNSNQQDHKTIMSSVFIIDKRLHHLSVFFHIVGYLCESSSHFLVWEFCNNEKKLLSFII